MQKRGLGDREGGAHGLCRGLAGDACGSGGRQWKAQRQSLRGRGWEAERKAGIQDTLGFSAWAGRGLVGPSGAGPLAQAPSARTFGKGDGHGTLSQPQAESRQACTWKERVGRDRSLSTPWWGSPMVGWGPGTRGRGPSLQGQRRLCLFLPAHAPRHPCLAHMPG